MTAILWLLPVVVYSAEPQLPAELELQVGSQQGLDVRLPGLTHSRSSDAINCSSPCTS